MIWFQFFQLEKQITQKLKDINDKNIQNFDEALHSVLLNLAKRIVADGEGASKFSYNKCFKI